MAGDPKSSKIRRRSPEQVERELAVNELGENEELPGGAEGGEDKYRPGMLSKDHMTPVGDTDQHSSPKRLPKVRREKLRRERAQSEKR